MAADLRRVGYTLDGVAGLLGESAYRALNRDQVIPALLATESATRGEGPGRPNLKNRSTLRSRRLALALRLKVDLRLGAVPC